MKSILIIFFLAIGINAHSQVAINNNGSLPDSSAMLDVRSGDKGILVPRMSSAKRDAIINPANGLLIFCVNDNNFYVNRGTSASPDWTSLYSYWATNGTDIYYIGDKVGIGTMNPTAKLDVRGSDPDDGIIFQVGNSDLSHRLMLFGGREKDPNPFIQWKQGDPLRFATDEDGWSEKMRITGNGKVGIGTTFPSAILDIAGGNNWDLVNGEGDFRLGNSQYRIKMGIATGGGGAGAAGIMQYGQTGGYNVLKFGAQGNYLLFLNGESQRVGIGTDNPGAALEISSTTQGFLPPRMAQGQIDALTPLTGLQVFNTTTSRPSYYDGAHWRNFDGTVATFNIGTSCLGGIIAYILQSGDPGYDADTLHGFITPPSNQSFGAAWGCYGTDISGADGTAIGTGKQNTFDIVAGCSSEGIAAKLCADLTLDGYSDWYLPSQDEFYKLYLNKAAISNFGNNFYWSSSEVSSTIATSLYLSDGSLHNANKSVNSYSVRCIRAF
jgi:hypothetical protein